MNNGIINIQKIINGETAKLSIAQIAFVLVNMSEAKKNLSPNDFRKVYGLFESYMKCTNMIDMDADLYYKNCKAMIRSFDGLAPFEKYSGIDDDDIEFANFLSEIREEVENERNMDEKYVLVKKAIEDIENEYSKIIEEMFFKVENTKIDNKTIIECHKKYSDLLCKYISETLDDEQLSKFISVINNPQQIDMLRTLNKSYFDTFGLNAGHILSVLYYIDGVNIDPGKCLFLSKMEREILYNVLYKLGEKYNVLINQKDTNYQSGCGFVIIFAIVSMITFSISLII